MVIKLPIMVNQPNNPQMLQMQMQELQKTEEKAKEYENKLASIKELTNVFLIALMCFVAVWVPFLFLEVQPIQQATWTAISIGSTLSITVLLVYIMLFSAYNNKAQQELYQRRMSLGVMPAPTEIQGYGFNQQPQPQPMQPMQPQPMQPQQQMNNWMENMPQMQPPTLPQQLIPETPPPLIPDGEENRERDNTTGRYKKKKASLK